MLKSFDRYILKELIPPFFVGLLVTTFVLLMNQILLLSEVFITRGVTLAEAANVLLYLIPSILAFTVPMGVLMGALAGLSRLSTDLEIMAFKTLGISYKRLLRPVLVFSFFGWLLSSYLALYLAPDSNYKLKSSLSQAVLSKVKFKIHPREFNESIPNTVIFMKGMTQEKSWEDVFVHFSDPAEEPKSIWAKQGRLNFYPEMRRAVLELASGAVHSYSLSEPEKYGVTSFEHFEQEINVENFFSPTLVKRVKEKDIEELFRDIKVINQDLATLSKEKEEAEGKKSEYGRRWRDYLFYWIEIYKKFSLPFACLVFGFLSLPLGASTKKGGRTSGFTISLGIILVYYVLITAGEKMAMDGKISPFFGMWGANILLLIIGLALFASSLKESVPFIGFLPPSREKEKSLAPGKKKAFSRKWLRLSLRFPNILDRYILKKYFAIFFLIFFGLILIIAIVTFFERIDNIYEHNKSFTLLFEYIIYCLPEFICRYIFPGTALTATLLSLGLLAKFNEITAMKACGISLFRVILPVLVMAILVSFASFYLQENVLPYANKKTEEVWDKINDVPPRSYSYLDRRWVLSKDKNRIYHYNYFDPQKTTFSQLSIYDFDSSWSLKRRIFSEKAYLNDSRLSLVNCWDREFVDGKLVKFEKEEKMEIVQVEDKSYFMKEREEPSQMSFGELRQYIKEIEERNFNTVRFKVDLLYKTSFPLASLVMTLLAIPFAFTMGKRGNLVGIGISIVIAIIYWFTIAIFQGFGYLNYLNAFLAAWGPNLIFGLTGLYLVFALRT